MVFIKTTNKEIIDQIQSILSLQVGRRFTQQEIVDLCIEFAQENLEELTARALNVPKLTPKLAKKILGQIDQFPDVLYDPSSKFANKIDEDIYSL